VLCKLLNSSISAYDNFAANPSVIYRIINELLDGPDQLLACCGSKSVSKSRVSHVGDQSCLIAGAIEREILIVTNRISILNVSNIDHKIPGEFNPDQSWYCQQTVTNVFLGVTINSGSPLHGDCVVRCWC
jgi:hypothetical protein